MRWRTSYKNNGDDWHRWFTWHPVLIDYEKRTWVWLEWVERSVLVHRGVDGFLTSDKRYREIKK